VNLENRKRLLIDFANSMGFDPMEAENWGDKMYLLQANGVH